MTPADLRAWITMRNITDTEAAAEIGCSPNQLRKWLRGELSIKRTVALACSALAFGLPPWKRLDDQDRRQENHPNDRAAR
jgi:transcriptional regulator with XRE-family HTH domain